MIWRLIFLFKTWCLLVVCIWFQLVIWRLDIWATSWDKCLCHANNKGADQPAHLCSLISTFVVPCLDRIIPIVSQAKISRLQPVFVAKQAGLCHTWRQPLEDRFSLDLAQFYPYPWYIFQVINRHCLGCWWVSGTQHWCRNTSLYVHRTLRKYKTWFPLLAWLLPSSRHSGRNQYHISHSWENLSWVVCDQVRLKLASSFTS